MKFEILKDRAYILLKGRDVTKLLQGLVTKNIEKLESPLTYCLMLNSQGKYLYELFLFKQEDGFIIDLFEPHKNDFINKLKLYKLRSQVEIIDVSDVYNTFFCENRFVDSLLSFPDPRYKSFGYRSLIKRTDLKNFNDSNLVENLYLQKKYQLAIVDQKELIQEKSFPLEFGMDYLNAIDFDKGCYIGQEPISRTKYRGVIRKNIFKVETTIDFIEFLIQDQHYVDENSFKLDSIINSNINMIMAANIEIGKLLSYHNNFGIALIRSEELHKAYEINALISISGVNIRVEVPEWRA